MVIILYDKNAYRAYESAKLKVIDVGYGNTVNRTYKYANKYSRRTPSSASIIDLVTSVKTVFDRCRWGNSVHEGFMYRRFDI